MSAEPTSSTINTTSLNDNTTISSTTDPLINKDLNFIPPSFFVGPHETEKTVTFEPELNDDSGSVTGYGNRRLSGILAETAEGTKKDESAIEIPTKRVILDAADANRGVFGDRRAKAAKRNANDNNKDNSSTCFVDSLEPSKTIRVFGYPPHLKANVIEHFMTYGKIEEFHESPGNWISITYASSAYALAALKSNGIMIGKKYMIGVSLEKNATPIKSEVIPLNTLGDVFKSYNGLGNGKVGVSVADKHDKSHTSNQGIVPNYSTFSKIKDVVFGW